MVIFGRIFVIFENVDFLEHMIILSTSHCHNRIHGRKVRANNVVKCCFHEFLGFLEVCHVWVFVHEMFEFLDTAVR